ncbi:MAG: response regulator [Deltaproteobacteria bacterium]|nr:response regulator [Deltaproteobacteria bacterium]
MTEKILKILLIEDEAAQARLVQEMIQEEGKGSVELEWASSLKETLSKLDHSSYDLILTDLALPDSFGLVTFEKIHAKTPHIPIIVLTGTIEDDEVALEALKKGAQDYLSKNTMSGFLLMRAIRYAIERKKLDQLKEEFIHTVSHEVRTPLTVVRGTIDNLLQGVGGTLSEKQGQMLRLGLRNLDRLGRIIHDVLDLARLESGKIQMSPGSVDLKDLVQELIDIFGAEAREREIKIISEFESGLKPVRGDRDLLLQLFVNLVGNALRYARSRVEISAKLLPSSHEVLVAVVDDGPGIPKERIGDLFQKFVQVGRPSGGTGYKGTGLGLVICKDIIQLHKGRIWCESEEGAGARFFFALPL